MKLTFIACENAGKRAKESGKTLKLADGLGLYLQAMPSGARYWRFKYRFAGKEKLLALGVYPEIGLKEARDKREWARKLLADNQDPSRVKKEKRLQAFTESENTFEKLAREWFEQQRVILTKKHADALVARFERDVFPHIGSLPVREIKPTYILEVCRKVEARKAYDVARRIKQTCGQIFRYGISVSRAERDPTLDLKDALRPYRPEHYATLNIKEIPEFLEVLERNEARLYLDTRLAMKLLMLTFVRTSELINAKWSEIDLDDATWIIPASRMKMRRDHIVPLSRQAVVILRELKTHNGHREWVFPNQVRPRKPMSNATITRALMRMGYKNRMTGHGFRALAMTTIKEKLGYRHEVIDRQLAHAHKSKIIAAYDRAQFLDDRRTMMQEYADYIDAMIKNKKAAGE